jgi:hypothetical protein
VIIPKWLIVYTVAIYCANFMVTGVVAFTAPSTCEGVVDCTAEGLSLAQFLFQFLTLGSLFELFDAVWVALLLLPLLIGWGSIAFQAIVDFLGAVIP